MVKFMQWVLAEENKYSNNYSLQIFADFKSHLVVLVVCLPFIEGLHTGDKPNSNTNGLHF